MRYKVEKNEDVKDFVLISTIKLNDKDEPYEIDNIKGYLVLRVAFGYPNALLKAYGIFHKVIENDYTAHNRCFVNEIMANNNKGYELLTRSSELKFYIIQE